MKRIFSIYFFPFLNTYNFQYLERLGGKTVLRCTYLFRRVHFLDSFLLRGVQHFFRIWQEGTCYLLSKDSVPLFPRNFGDSFITSRHADCCPSTQFFSRARYPGVWLQFQHISSRRLLS